VDILNLDSERLLTVDHQIIEPVLPQFEYLILFPRALRRRMLSKLACPSRSSCWRILVDVYFLKSRIRSEMLSPSGNERMR
jgi:hypothetical protein